MTNVENLLPTADIEVRPWDGQFYYHYCGGCYSHLKADQRCDKTSQCSKMGSVIIDNLDAPQTEPLDLNKVREREDRQRASAQSPHAPGLLEQALALKHGKMPSAK